jgi:hypothetical protein
MRPPSVVIKRSRSGRGRSGAYATWAEQLREGDKQVDGEDGEFAHGANATMIASTRKTALRARIPQC